MSGSERYAHMRYEKKKRPQDRHLWHTGNALVVPDPGKPGHCPGKISVNCGYCLRKIQLSHSGSAAHVTCPGNMPAVKLPVRNGHGEALKKHHLLQ